MISSFIFQNFSGEGLTEPLALPFRNEKTNVNFVTSYKCNGFGNSNISRTILGRTLV